MARKALIVGERATLVSSGLPSFIKAPWEKCDAENLKRLGVKAVFLGVPFDQATAYRSGSNQGPKGLRSVSEMFLPYLGEFDVDLFEEFNLVDCGDVPVVPANPERSREVIEEYVGRVLDAGAFPICIGGDHSIPIPLGRALSRRIKGNFGYLHFDAHLDCALDVAGEPYTNWSAVARMCDLPNVEPDNIAIVGVRGAVNPPEQWQFVKDKGIRVYTMRDVIRSGIEAVVEDALVHVTDGTETFYVSWDTDVIDCAYLPGTDGPEPNGLTSREVLRAAEMVGAKKPALMDISELIPSYDHPGYISCRLSCYLIFNLLGGMATQGQIPPRP